ncbi:MAG TPA: DUF885 domain-containing protein [candidate division Zixibacteria bacterium]
MTTLRRMKLCAALLLAPLLSGCAKTEPPMEQLDLLYADYWEDRMARNPTWATYEGDHRFDSLLEDVSPAAVEDERLALQEFRKRLDGIRTKGGVASGDLNVELFEREIDLALEDMRWKRHLMPVSQQNGVHISFPELITFHPFETPADCENFIRRLRAFPALVDQTIANMRSGMAEGLVPARVIMEKTVPQIEAQIVDDPNDSPLAGALAEIDSSIVADDRQGIADDILAAINDDVVPAYRKLGAFVRDEYLPACRDSVGCHALPDGRERYAYFARRYTTTNLTPNEIFEIGQREVASIRRQMEAIKDSTGFRGSLPEFIAHLKSDPTMFFEDKDSLVSGFKSILAEMDGKLPELFGRLPKAPYDFREIEEFRAASAPAAYYYSAPEDRSRPGYFYINTYQPRTRPKYTMQALAFHEAVPGHHLQIAIQQELEDLPKFRKQGGYTAFVEGWGLYSERLPKEVGFYGDWYSEFGRLTFEAWRAVRLVVDVGIHDKGWSREQAIAFCRANTALTDHDIESEIERYIAWPGQALAYKIGQLKILELRQRARDTLGARFDIRTFHDELLSDGALPLDLLEAKMSRWLQRQVEST